ncbi:unnamed protein product, partial [Phaeothamnion confervicola]
LLPQHQRILSRILREVITLAQAEVEVEKKFTTSGVYPASLVGRQPHLSFLIDGPKGAGKTTVLFNLRHAIDQIGPKLLIADRGASFSMKEVATKFSYAENLEDFTSLQVGSEIRRLAHALPVIKPDAMEAGEQIMESIFAELTTQLDYAIER